MGLENHHLKRPGQFDSYGIYVYMFHYVSFWTPHQPELLGNLAVFPDTGAAPKAEVLRLYIFI